MGDRLPIKMLHDRVLVRMSREEGERRSSGGILIPATAQISKRLIWGEVLAVGNHVRTVCCIVAAASYTAALRAS